MNGRRRKKFHTADQQQSHKTQMFLRVEQERA